MTLPINDSFENLSSITFGKTTRLSFQKTKTLPNGDKEIVDSYDIIYKPVIEKSLMWDFKNGQEWEDILTELQTSDPTKYSADFINWIHQKYQTPSKTDDNPMPKEAYVFNTYNYRKRLSETKIKVHKLNDQTVWYDIGSQVMVNIPTEIENVESFEYDMSRFKQIENPWVFSPSENESIKDIIPLNEEIVLPYITDADVVDGYITFLDDSEILPEWKRAEALKWTSFTTYNVNDVIIYNNKYYLVLSQYTTDKKFELVDNIKHISKKEAEEYLKPSYFPTLDILYTNNDVVRSAIKQINDKEAYGKYGTAEEFINWELIFEPIFDNDIDNVGIKIYNPNNSRKPDFQLI